MYSDLNESKIEMVDKYFLYFIRPKNNLDLFKIGVTKNLYERFRCFSLEVDYSKSYYSEMHKSLAFAIESAFKDEFKRHKYNDVDNLLSGTSGPSEWFEISISEHARDYLNQITPEGFHWKSITTLYPIIAEQVPINDVEKYYQTEREMNDYSIFLYILKKYKDQMNSKGKVSGTDISEWINKKRTHGFKIKNLIEHSNTERILEALRTKQHNLSYYCNKYDRIAKGKELEVFYS